MVLMLGSSLTPAVTWATPATCQHAIERGAVRYLNALTKAMVDCALPTQPSGRLSTCLEAPDPAAAARLSKVRALWVKRAAPACTGVSLGHDLGYHGVCTAAPYGSANACRFATAVLDAPGDHNDALDCLACQMEVSIEFFGSQLFAYDRVPGIEPYDKCFRTAGSQGLDALRVLVARVHKCLQNPQATSIAACLDDPAVSARVAERFATWRARADTVCGPLANVVVGNGFPGWQAHCNGDPGVPGAFCRARVYPCTFATTMHAVSTPAPDDDLMDCLQCQVEENALFVLRNVHGANVCCVGATCDTVRGRAACALAGGTPAYYRIDTGPTGFNLPHGLAVGDDGTLWIADSIDATRENRLTTVAPDGTQTVVATFPPPIPVAGPVIPTGVTLDGAGNAYVALGCEHQVVRVTVAGNVQLVAGTATGGHSGDGGPATSAQIASPRRVAVDATGNLYFTESSVLGAACGNSAGGGEYVRVVDPAGIIHTFAGTGAYGSGGEDGPALMAQFGIPLSLQMARDGGLLLGEVGINRVLRITPAGIVTRLAGVPANPYGVYRGDGGPARDARFFSIEGVSEDADGNVLVSDFQNNRVRLVDRLGSIITIAGDGLAPGGQPALSGDGGPGTLAQVGCPQDLAPGPDGRFWFENEQGGDWIRVLSRVSF
jgi:hypothetical protein